MSDLISRQTAIDAVNSGRVKEDGMHLWRCERNETLDAVVELLEAVPSVQPEITPDGTLKVTVDADIASIGRILLSQTGTQEGGLYYKDAQPEGTCESCLHQELEWDEEPCDGCTVGGDTNHYKPSMGRRTDVKVDKGASC